MRCFSALVDDAARVIFQIGQNSDYYDQFQKNPVENIVTTVVLGSGLSGFAEERKGDKSSIVVPHEIITGFPRIRVEGHEGELILTPINYFDYSAGWVATLSGRAHGYEFADPIGRRQIAVPVLALAQCGCKTFILTNAVGAVNKSSSFAPESIVLLRDHINLSGWSPLLGHPGDRFQRFPSMANCYNKDLRIQALSVARKLLKNPLSQGTLATVLGPNFETAAEVRMLSALGADIVGMSVAYETIALRALLNPPNVIGLSCVVNWAEGVSNEPIAHDKVLQVANKINPELSLLIHGIINEIVESNLLTSTQS